MYIFEIILKIVLIGYTRCYNLDFEYAVAKNGPVNSLFGFSVAQHQDLSGGNPENWMIVGAPKASNIYLQSRYNESGSVFKCDPSNPSFNCTTELPFDKDVSRGTQENKSNQWLGVSLDSGGKYKEVVSCAHRYEYFGSGGEFKLLEGRCYLLGEKLDGSGRSKFGVCNAENRERSKTPSHEEYGMCLSGVGMKILPEVLQGETSLLIGAPGTKWWSGEVIEMDTTDDKSRGMLPEKADSEKYRDSYFGYAIAYGNFLEKDSLQIASGGPHHQHSGKILIYSQKADSNKIKKVLQQIPASGEKVQIASGFGIALCAIDSDNNGLSELAVGAPFYLLRGAKDRPESGIVYIYSKADGQNALSLRKTLYGEKSSYSNFGYAVANGGDLDIDGYEDLIVGAPREDSGAGAIYVYHGSKKGIIEKYIQRVGAGSIHSGLTDNIGLKGFGRSLGTGHDLDDNGYKDVLVGAYISDQVALLRSRPVIGVKSTMQFEPNEVDISVTECPFKSMIKAPCSQAKLCVNITEASGKLKSKQQVIRLKYYVEADPIRNPRVKFEQTDSNIYSFILKSDSFFECIDMGLVYVVKDKDGKVAEYPDIKFKVSYTIPYGDTELPKPERSALKVPSLDEYPILQQRIEDDGTLSSLFTADFQLKFKRDCTGDCIPNLSITSPKSKYTLRSGGDDFYFFVTVENNGDTAYSVSLRINTPKSLQFNDVLLVDENRVLTCPSGFCEGIFDKLKRGMKKEFRISLGTDAFDPLHKDNVSVIVSSANEERPSTVADNKLDIMFDLKIVADVELLAVPVTPRIAFQGEIKGESAMTSLEDIGAFVEHTYAIRNNGPDKLPSANITIKWPYQTESGKHLLYLVSVNNPNCTVTDENVLNLRSDGTTAKSSQPSKSAVAPSVRSSNSEGKQRVRREASNSSSSEDPSSAKVNSRKKEGIILDCVGDTADCVDIKCSFENINSGSSVSVPIIARLWEPSLLLDYYGEVITIVSHGAVVTGKNLSYISDPDPTNEEKEAFTVVLPVFAPKSKDKIAVWQIALAVVAGVILLALMIFGLYKVGFFKRKQRSYDEADDKLLDKKSGR